MHEYILMFQQCGISPINHGVTMNHSCATTADTPHAHVIAATTRANDVRGGHPSISTSEVGCSEWPTSSSLVMLSPSRSSSSSSNGTWGIVENMSTGSMQLKRSCELAQGSSHAAANRRIWIHRASLWSSNSYWRAPHMSKALPPNPVCVMTGDARRKSSVNQKAVVPVEGLHHRCPLHPCLWRVLLLLLLLLPVL